MEYPPEFSPQARARVEAERLKASRDLDRYRSQPGARPRRKRSSGPYGLLWTEEEEDLHEYILRVWLVFAEQACELGRADPEAWPMDRIRKESAEFLRRFTIEAHSERGYDRSGHRLRDMVGHWDGSLLPEVEQEFRRSVQWGKFEKKLSAVAKRQALRTPQKNDSAVQGTDRRKAVDAYIEQVSRSGKRITRTDIWKSTGDRTRTEFERWESGWYEKRGGKTNRAANQRFTRILRDKPHLKPDST